MALQLNTDVTTKRKFLADSGTPTTPKRTLVGEGGTAVANALADNVFDGETYLLSQANAVPSRLENAIATIGANATLVIDVNETLLGDTYTIPYGVTLLGGGGVLSAIAATTLTIKGTIESNIKLLDHDSHASRGVIDILLPQINIRWFGALNSGEAGADELANTNAIESTWLAGRKVGGNQNGGVVYVPGPAQFDVKLLDFSALSGGGQRIMRGDGQRISSFRVGVGETTGLLDATASSFFNGEIEGISFSGLRALNNTTQPVLIINSYNFSLHNAHITDGDANGVEVKLAGQVTLLHIDSEKHNDWGFYIHGVAALSMISCGTDQCDIGGLLIERDETQSNDRNKHAAINIENFYVEASPIGVKLAGVGGVFINGITSAGGATTEVIRFATYTDASGDVWNATGNIVYIRGLQGDHQQIIFESGCTGNVVFLPPDEQLNVVIKDSNLPGLNKVVPHGGQMACVRDLPPVTKKDFATIENDSGFGTHRTAFSATTGTSTVTLEDSFIVHPASAHVVAQTNHVCLAITDTAAAPLNNTLQLVATATAIGTYYVNMLVWYDYSAFLRILIQRTGGDKFDWTTSTFKSSGFSQESFVARIEGGRPQWLSVPFALPSLENLTITAQFQSLHNGNKLRVQYGPVIVDKANAGLIYMSGGTILGANDHWESTTVNLPPVAEFTLGLEVFDITTLTRKINSGAAWV